MKIAIARELLTVDINTLSLEKLQRHKVRLIDAWRESRADYGFFQAVRDGFYCAMRDIGAVGYTPVDKWLTQNLQLRLEDCEKRERYLLSLSPQ